ncbi:MAG: type II toxin-antitoxin system VapC family toxin [Proteobacteria bacterium]|nr:type II toxin-antitoxin system VapC family toxin [Pseudomonadota bacterium]
MRYLLDSNACIALLNSTSPPLRTRIRRQRPSDIGLSVVVTYELYYGAFKSRRVDRNIELLDRLAFEVVPFDASDARVAGAIRSELEAVGRPIGPYDVLIAGQARARGLTLVTANSDEFLRVKDLDCEDWSG